MSQAGTVLTEKSKKICMCGHAVSLHGMVKRWNPHKVKPNGEVGGWEPQIGSLGLGACTSHRGSHLSERNQAYEGCRCNAMQVAVSVTNARKFMYKDNFEGHALIRGLIALKASGGNYTWVREFKCDFCGIKPGEAEESNLYVVQIEGESREEGIRRIKGILTPLAPSNTAVTKLSCKKCVEFNDLHGTLAGNFQ